jgi:mannose-6-phosphate isomerase-like protein (cupin superfamily)
VNGHLSSARAGDIILVPERETHNLRNKGNGRARVLGVFGGANQIVAEFEQSWLPLHSNRVNTRDLMNN